MITMSILIIMIIIIIIMDIIKTYVPDCSFRLLFVKLSRGPPQNFTDHMLYMTGLFLYFSS
jgi:hypothetical protein